jgi:hypothetical protein
MVSYNGNVFYLLQYGVEIVGSLAGLEYRAGYAGPRFIDTFKIAVTIIALHIAIGCNRQMYSPEFMFCSFAKTGMIFVIHDCLLYVAVSHG